MSKQDTLNEAVEKAIRGGFKAEIKGDLLHILNASGENTAWYGRSSWGSYSLIFSHDFAKALWGEPWAYFTEGQSGDTIGGNFINWKGHLANMVVSDDPIEYLRKNI